jgi:hypothetical protein
MKCLKDVDILECKKEKEIIFFFQEINITGGKTRNKYTFTRQRNGRRKKNKSIDEIIG